MSASYRNEDGPKGLRRDPVDAGFAIVDPGKLFHWSGIVAAGATRIPVLPLIVALYHDSDLASGRSEIDAADFRRDFDFTALEFATYFDSDAESRYNQELVRRFPGLDLSWSQPLVGEVPVPEVGRRTGTPRSEPRGPRGPIDPDSLPAAAAGRSQPPAGGHWWSAEQAVETYLRDSGWHVVNRTRQLVGFDLEIRRPNAQRSYFIEVKSSVGPCSPVMTRNEFEAAKRHPKRYILAVVENFELDGDVSILWVRNPAALVAGARTVQQFPIPRSVWLRNANLDLEG
jgi:hypothetical protein